MPRVTAILVARNGEAHLERTLAALAAQTRPVDALLVVDAGSTDRTPELLTRAQATHSVRTPAVDYGEAVRLGLRSTPPPRGGDDEWLWLLSADTAPHPEALQALLAAVEVAPSVAVAGPKVVDPDDAALILSYGVSLSNQGATVPMVDRELDQAQHDTDGDVLGVDLTAMLVRRPVWDALGGTDPGLPSTDAGLDLSVRARLAGHRVIRVAAARVGRAEHPEDFGRRKPLARAGRARIARAAQLHRRLVYAPAWAVPLHWLSLLPLAILRSLGHLLGKRPGAVGGEFAAALSTAVRPSGVGAARRRLKAQRTMGWPAVAALRLPSEEVRERAATRRERLAAARGDDDVIVRAEFFSGGGVWVVGVALLVGVAMFHRLLGAPALEGGAALPLASDVGALWSRLGVGWRDIGTGFVGAADPFVAVIAVLGSITFWNPSLSMVLLWLAALPLAALGAWWCATRLSTRSWPPIVAGALWALAPPLLVALGDGRIPAVLAHLLLPWLVFAAIEGVRSWSAGATASLLFAAVAACAPVLAPALLLGWLAWVLARPRAAHRLLGIPIPAVALFAPLVVEQVGRGTPLALLADPGAVAGFAVPSGWQLTLASPDASGLGWPALLTAFGADAGAGLVVLAALCLPLALLALAALFLPAWRRVLAALGLALLGLVTAIGAAHLALTADGAVVVTVWPGAGLSLYWLGLAGAAVLAVDALRRAGVLAGLVLLLTTAAAVSPVVGAGVRDELAARDGDGVSLPALVSAEAATRPGIGTLVLTAQPDGSIAARLQRGEGTTLDDTSTLAATRTDGSGDARTLAELAGNLASRSGYDPAKAIEDFGIEYVLVTEGREQAPVAERRVLIRTAEALDATAQLESVGRTSSGLLWRFPEPSAARDVPGQSAFGATMLLVQGIVVGAALLLAIPTGRRRRVMPAEPHLGDDDPADTFDEDEHG